MEGRKERDDRWVRAVSGARSALARCAAGGWACTCAAPCGGDDLACGAQVAMVGVSRGLRVIAAERERRERESELGRAREERGRALGFGVWGKAGPGWGSGPRGEGEVGKGLGRFGLMG